MYCSPLKCGFCGGNHLIGQYEAEFYAQYPHLKPPAYSPPLVYDFCGENHVNGRYMTEAPHPSLVTYLGDSLVSKQS